jgi:mRNA interferase MazF
LRRGEIWLAEVGGKPRPVVVLTRDEVIDVRTSVTVAEITTQARGLAVEVAVDAEAGVDQASVANGDGLHTIAQRRLTRHLGSISDETLGHVCDAVAAALGCDRH